MTRKRVLVGAGVVVTAVALALAIPVVWAYHDATRPFRASVECYDVSADGITLTVTYLQGGGDVLVSSRVAREDDDRVDVEIILRGPGFAPHEAIMLIRHAEFTLQEPLGARLVTAFDEEVQRGSCFAVTDS